ncbi:hypothetical protein PAXRUDRAFT_73428, partial [Paxillus rubicundulus Ve08.2h10]
PKHSGNGFWNIDDPPNSWGDPSIHLGATLFNLCYLFLAPHASTFLFHLFSCAHSQSKFSPVDNKGHSPTYNYLTSTNSVPTPTAISASGSAVHHGLAYKPVSRKVMAVPAPLLEGLQIVYRLPNDPLAGLKPLLTKPPDFILGTHFTEERAEALDLNPA